MQKKGKMKNINSIKQWLYATKKMKLIYTNSNMRFRIKITKVDINKINSLTFLKK